jgi:hypothetical protein
LYPMFGLPTPSQESDHDEIELAVPSDPKAKYFVLDLQWLNQSVFEITTRREGVSGTSYSKREIDCSKMQFRYTGDAGSLIELSRQNLDSAFGSLVEGSISQVVSSYVCRNTKHAR